MGWGNDVRKTVLPLTVQKDLSRIGYKKVGALCSPWPSGTRLDHGVVEGNNGIGVRIPKGLDACVARTVGSRRLFCVMVSRNVSELAGEKN